MWKQREQSARNCRCEQTGWRLRLRLSFIVFDPSDHSSCCFCARWTKGSPDQVFTNADVSLRSDRSICGWKQTLRSADRQADWFNSRLVTRLVVDSLQSLARRLRGAIRLVRRRNRFRSAMPSRRSGASRCELYLLISLAVHSQVAHVWFVDCNWSGALKSRLLPANPQLF